MRSRFLPYQLGTFALIAILGILYVEFGVLGVHPVSQPYHVTVQLDRAGGIFPHANVDYRGQQVGSVNAIKLRPGGVDLDIQIDQGVQVPADSKVAITALSGVGEQYVDLRPQRAGPPYLKDGSVISKSNTTVPLTIATVLVDLEQLVGSINPDDLSVVVDESANAYANTGPQLRDLLLGGNDVFQQLRSVAPQTVDLEKTAGVNLATADKATGEFTQFSASLGQLTDQVKASDGDVRGVIDNGSAASQQIDQVLRDDGPAMATLLGNGVTWGNIVVARVPAIEQLLVAVPIFGGNLAAAIQGDRIQSEGYFNNKNTVCTYLAQSQMRSPLDTSARAPFLNLDCANSAPDMLQRGAKFAPRPPGDRPAPSSTANSTAAGGGAQATSYDPATGMVTTPDGTMLKLGADGGQSAAYGDQSWVTLLLAGASP